MKLLCCWRWGKLWRRGGVGNLLGITFSSQSCVSLVTRGRLSDSSGFGVLPPLILGAFGVKQQFKPLQRPHAFVCPPTHLTSSEPRYGNVAVAVAENMSGSSRSLCLSVLFKLNFRSAPPPLHRSRAKNARLMSGSQPSRGSESGSAACYF